MIVEGQKLIVSTADLLRAAVCEEAFGTDFEVPWWILSANLLVPDTENKIWFGRQDLLLGVLGETPLRACYVLSRS